MKNILIAVGVMTASSAFADSYCGAVDNLYFDIENQNTMLTIGNLYSGPIDSKIEGKSMPSLLAALQNQNLNVCVKTKAGTIVSVSVRRSL